jgi:hypothetical protein
MSTLRSTNSIAIMRHQATVHQLGLDRPRPVVRTQDEILAEAADREARRYQLIKVISERWPAIGIRDREPLLLDPNIATEIAEALAGAFSSDEVSAWLSWWRSTPKYRAVARAGGHRQVLSEIVEQH